MPAQGSQIALALGYVFDLAVYPVLKPKAHSTHSLNVSSVRASSQPLFSPVVSLGTVSRFLQVSLSASQSTLFQRTESVEQFHGDWRDLEGETPVETRVFCSRWSQPQYGNSRDVRATFPTGHEAGTHWRARAPLWQLLCCFFHPNSGNQNTWL